MANKSSPVFPMPNEPQHFSDYGFDPQMDYLQMLEEARKHKREITSTPSTTARSTTTDQALHFKLQKPISKEDSSSSLKNKKQKKKKSSKWWKNALVFWRWKWNNNNNNNNPYDENDFDIHPRRNHHHQHRAAAVTCAYRGGTISGPVYITESRSGSNTPCRATTTGSRPTSGPLTWNHLMTPNRKGETENPYVSLKELNLDHHQQPDTRISTSAAAMPIYLVT